MNSSMFGEKKVTAHKTCVLILLITFVENQKQAMEARREKRRGRRRSRKTWEDCAIDAARRKGKTFVELKRLARNRIAFRKWNEDPTLQGNLDG
jgi:hypothetical protein